MFEPTTRNITFVARDEATVFAFCNGRNMVVPVVTTTCELCMRLVDMGADGSFYLDRVGANSENGYQPIHHACEDALSAAPAERLMQDAPLCIHPSVFALDSTTPVYCGTCNKEIPAAQL